MTRTRYFRPTVLVLCLALAACGGKSKESKGKKKSTSTASQPATTGAPTAEDRSQGRAVKPPQVTAAYLDPRLEKLSPEQVEKECVAEAALSSFERRFDCGVAAFLQNRPEKFDFAAIHFAGAAKLAPDPEKKAGAKLLVAHSRFMKGRHLTAATLANEIGVEVPGSIDVAAFRIHYWTQVGDELEVLAAIDRFLQLRADASGQQVGFLAVMGAISALVSIGEAVVKYGPKAYRFIKSKTPSSKPSASDDRGSGSRAPEVATELRNVVLVARSLFAANPR
jgi:hypothetical protein